MNAGVLGLEVDDRDSTSLHAMADVVQLAGQKRYGPGEIVDGVFQLEHGPVIRLDFVKTSRYAPSAFDGCTERVQVNRAVIERTSCHVCGRSVVVDDERSFSHSRTLAAGAVA